MPKEARGNQITYQSISQEKWDAVFGKRTPEKLRQDRAEFMAKQAQINNEPRTKKAKWPIASHALATNNPEKDAAIAKKHGVSVEFNEDGCPILQSEYHRKQYIRALKSETGIGYQDRSAWY